MLSALVNGAEALGFSLAREAGLIEVALGEVVRRGDEVDYSLLEVHAHLLDDVERSVGDGQYLLAVAADAVEVAPAVALALPGEPPGAVEPGRLVGGVHPGGIGLGEDVLPLRGVGADNPDTVGVLGAVHLLDEELVALGDELHAGDVVLARVAGQLYPGGGTSAGRNRTDADGGVGGAGLGVGEALDGGVEGVDVVDDGEPAGALRVALPVGDALSVGTPAEAVAAVELLLIDPVEGAVDAVGPSISGQGGTLAISQTLHVDIVSADVGHAVGLRSKLGKHQRGLGQSLT